MADEGGINREVLLDKGCRTVQKLCREIMDLPQPLKSR
jgi:hypothetical protein